MFRSVKVNGVESEDRDQPEVETYVPDGNKLLLGSHQNKPSEWMGRNDVIIVYNNCYCSPLTTVLPIIMYILFTVH